MQQNDFCFLFLSLFKLVDLTANQVNGDRAWSIISNKTTKPVNMNLLKRVSMFARQSMDEDRPRFDDHEGATSSLALKYSINFQPHRI